MSRWAPAASVTVKLAVPTVMESTEVELPNTENVSVPTTIRTLESMDKSLAAKTGAAPNTTTANPTIIDRYFFIEENIFN